MDRRLVVAGAVALAAVGAGIWLGRGVGVAAAGGRAAVGPVTITAAQGPPTTIVVHVSGWVVSPGLVELPAAARMGDALAAAGGARPGARLDSVNLAQPLGDGQQLVVPGPGDVPAGPTGAGDPAGGLININAATAAELEALPGVGPVLAERIVAHRQDMGPFQTVEDLLGVSGIGEAKLASIRDLVAAP